MISTLALCLSLHTSGPVALALQFTDGARAGDTVNVAAPKRPGKTKPPPKNKRGKADPRTKPGLEIPPRGQPGHGGGPF